MNLFEKGMAMVEPDNKRKKWIIDQLKQISTGQFPDGPEDDNIEFPTWFDELSFDELDWLTRQDSDWFTEVMK
ncbi:MAG: hypothetical protein LKF36_15405 [Lactobacillus sp.]|jgi:hypothetical protein|nr:hypothetical protein [Lactobacillus sp.]